MDDFSSSDLPPTVLFTPAGSIARWIDWLRRCSSIGDPPDVFSPVAQVVGPLRI
jgi:hypothetical protein